MKPKSTPKTPPQPVGAAAKNAPEKPKGKPLAGATKAGEGGCVPIVGVGASAGGLEALEELFSKMPLDTGMAFVVVMHQPPGHASLLPELLSKKTRLTVMEVEGGMTVEPNCVYIGPTSGYLDVFNGRLLRMDAESAVAGYLPIDHFFRSLAQDQKEGAIGIILSGAGSDGTMGMGAIKGESGMTMVQAVESASYGGMPSSAIAQVNPDYVLRPEAMPPRLVAYAHRPSRAGPAKSKGLELEEEPLQKIFVLLRERTGHDFSGYKVNTICRRVERRMNVHAIELPEEYVRYLQENPHEIDILFKELLISVTSFFRDPPAYQALGDKALVELLEARGDGQPLRVWVPGCATGEEAYSLAILLRECMEATQKTNSVQIFATDLDREAIDFARLGCYAEGIAADVSPERLERFFECKDQTYRVHKYIREMVVFAVQDVVQDPPFTKLDCIVCRNLMIYFNSELQQKLLPVFHYALNPGGLLFLGTSETIGSFSDLFQFVDKKWKIFRRKEPLDVKRRMLCFPSGRTTLPAGELAGLAPRAPVAVELNLAALVDRLLLERFAPASVVVNNKGDVIFIYGRIGGYLELVAGQPRLNVHEMAREGLRSELSCALRKASAQDEAVKRVELRVGSEGERHRVDLSVAPIHGPEQLRGLYLVSFEPSRVSALELCASPQKEALSDPGLAEALERELSSTRESLKRTIGELEVTNEELMSTNEELQSTNEELQSSNEELETSKEEMQSLNDELSTVNSDLNLKIEDLSCANDDMQNLLNSTKIATIFLDLDLNIKRYTEQAIGLVRLIQADVGRPLADLASNLNYDQVVSDAKEVLRTLATKEAELQTKSGQWFLMRIMPYRTSENVIAGLVLTFVDIDPVKKTEQELAAAKECLAADLQAMTRLYQIGTLFLGEGASPVILEEVLDAAICISLSELGQIHRIDPSSGRLKVMEQRGFKRAWLDAWEGEVLAKSGFMVALRKGDHVLVEDIATDLLLAHTPLPEVFSKAGIRSMLSIPLINPAGGLVGAISVYYKASHQPEARVLRLLDLLGHQAAQILARISDGGPSGAVAG